MTEQIVAQEGTKVKCSYEGCEEPVFREGICWAHFMEEKLAEWDAQDAERQACWAGVGRGWRGYPAGEVCR